MKFYYEINSGDIKIEGISTKRVTENRYALFTGTTRYMVIWAQYEKILPLIEII